MQSLFNGIITVFIANAINIFCNALTNFLLPKYLSVDTYAYIKTFLLYISYIGVFHLGYVDGIYLKYGGKQLKELNTQTFYDDAYTLQLFQIVLGGVGVLISAIFHNYILLLALCSMLPINMTMLYRMLFQAMGEFKQYSKIIKITSFANFLCILLLIFIYKTDNYRIFIFCYVVVYYFIWFILEYYIRHAIPIEKKRKFSLNILLSNIRDGILITIGNFFWIILTGMDQWCVKYLLDTTAFAQYSFSASMLGLLHIVTTPIGTVLYSYFCRELNAKEIKKIINIVAIMGAGVIWLAFPTKVILEKYLSNYLSSSVVIFLLFGSALISFIISSIYINLYKAQKRQKTYFNKLLICVAIGFVLNIICYAIYPYKETFAVGTLLTYAVWFIMCALDFKTVRYDWKGLLYICVEIIVFIFCGTQFSAITGGAIYALVTAGLSIIVFTKEFKFIINKFFLIRK